MKTELQQEKVNLNYKATKEELTTELKAAIAEFFVGVCKEQDKTLVLDLVNGQSFRISVEEIVNE